MSSTAKTLSSPTVSKRNLGLAGLAAFGACAACCAVPLLAAAGVGGGLLTTLAGYIRPGADLVVAGAVGLGVLGVLAVQARRRTAASASGTEEDAACGTSCSTAGGCGCGPSGGKPIFSTGQPSANEPIVCTADLDDKPSVQAQLDGYRAAFAHLRATETFPRGFRWIFEPREGLEAELRTLAQNEHDCCRFFRFDLHGSAERIVWEVTADERGLGALKAFEQLPQHLAKTPREQDAVAIEQSVRAAGLVFAADNKSK